VRVRTVLIARDRYDLDDDPLPRPNHFDDPAKASLRAILAKRLLAQEVCPGERALPDVLMAPVRTS
jgi:hypothetical protein